MRPPFYFPSWSAVIICCIFWLSACNRPIAYPTLFAVADSLASVTPDSAVAMLASWKEEMKNEPEHVRNYYLLLCIKANDNAQIAHTSDSLIKCLVRYYEDDGDKRRLPETYYYAGRVLRDMADAPQAIKYFERALEATSGEKHLSLQSKIYCQLGGIFEFQNLPGLALEMARKAYDCDTRLEARGNMVHDLDNMAGLHWKCLRPDSAEFYYKAAVSLAETLNDTLQANLIKRHLGHLYIELGRYDEVEEQIRPYLNLHDNCDRYETYGITAKYFLTVGQYDSARFYYEKSFSEGDIYAKKSAYWGFAQIAFAQNNLEEGQRNLARYDLCLDSILKITSTKTVGQTHFGYNYELHEKENLRLKERYAREQYYSILILIVLGIILTGVAALIIYKRGKNKPAVPTESETFPILSTSPDSPPTAVAPEPAETIENQEKTPQILFTAPVHGLFAEPDEGTTGNHSEISVPESQEPAEAMSQSELHAYLLAKANQIAPLTEHDWDIVASSIRKNFPSFITRLYKTHSCSTVELRTCMLVKLKVPPTNIAIFIGRSKEGVSSIRRRLCKKVFGGKGSAPKWDAFIDTL